MKRRVRKALPRAVAATLTLFVLVWFFVYRDLGTPRLTPESVVEELGEDTLWANDVAVAHYRRTGVPIIRPGVDRSHKVVTIPGHWVADTEEGKRLEQGKYPPIMQVDRVETYTYWMYGPLPLDGFWGRHAPRD